MNIKIYFTKGYFIFFCLISLIITNPLKAELKLITTSIWDFWYLNSFNKEYNNTFYLTGITKALLLKHEDYNKIKLYFGVNSSRDGNFNYINTKEILLYGNLYLDSDIGANGLLTLGFKAGDLSKTQILITRGYGLGIPQLPLFASYETNGSNRVVFDGSYMQNNEAFSLTYNHKIWVGSTNIGISYIPNLDCNLSNSRSVYRDLQKNLGALDGYINFYNEYQDIGYGIISGARIYAKNFFQPEGVELFVSPNIDYLGLGVALSFLGGKINGLTNKLSYSLSELILYYSILKFNISASYGYNTVVNSKHEDYNYRNVNLSASYFLNSKFSVKGGLFYNKITSYTSNKGLALGFNINV